MPSERNYQAQKQVVADSLVAHGWSAVSDRDMEITYGVATKDFETAAGIRTAIAYFEAPREGRYPLTGEYLSEGRNVLSTMFIRIPVDASAEGLREAAEQFVREAEAVIEETYAVRLARSAEEEAPARRKVAGPRM